MAAAGDETSEPEWEGARAQHVARVGDVIVTRVACGTCTAGC